MTQTITKFPPISLDARFPSRPFEVPRPIPPERHLGSEKCFFANCSDRSQIDRLVTEFNEANQKTKILKVLRAVTPSATRCDFDTEMLRIDEAGKKVVQRESVAINVVETSRQCVFSRISDGAARLNSGTFIQSNTPYLADKDTSGGIVSSNSLLRFAKDTIAAAMSPITALNPLKLLSDNAISADTTATTTLADIAVNQTLGNCPAVSCSDQAILTEIMNRYNAENAADPAEQFGVEQRVMRSILKAGAGGGSTCDIMFQEQVESYDDILYDPIETKTITSVKRVQLTDTGGCKFQVATGTNSFIDISSNAAGLLSQRSTLTRPFTQPAPCVVNCRDPAILKSVKESLERQLTTATSIPTFKQVTQSFQNGSSICEYKMIKDISEKDPYTRQFATDSGMETYVTANVNRASSGTCAYTVGEVKEFFPDAITTVTNPQTGLEDSYIGSTPVTLPLLMGYDDTVKSKKINATVTSLV
jgi:hypothetical protein